MDDLAVGAVAKRHPIENDLPPDRGKVGRAGPLGHRRLSGEQLAELGDGRAALLVGVVELDQGLHGGEEGGQEQQVGGQLAHGDAPAGRHRATHPEEHGLGGDADGLAARPVERVGPGGPEVGVAVADDDIAVLGDAGVPAVVGRDDPDPGQRLREVAEEFADPVPHGAVVGRGPAPEPHRGRHRGRHRGHQGDDGQQRVVAEEQTGDHHQGQGLHREVDDPLLEQHRQGLDVRGHPGQQHARLLVGVEVHALALHVGEGSDAEALHQPLAEAAGERGAHRAERGGDHQQSRIGQGRGRQDAAVAGQDAIVHADLGEDRSELYRHCLNSHQGEGRGQPVAVWPQEPPEPELPVRLVGLPRPGHRRLGVLGLVQQDLLDPGP